MSPQSPENHVKRGAIHHILARSYSVFFCGFLLGVLYDLFCPNMFFTGEWTIWIGGVLIVVGSYFVHWAQSTSQAFNKRVAGRSPELSDFMHGPYRYTRGPTHIGLFLMLFGFGILVNSLGLVIFSVVSYIVAKVFFLNKEEKLLHIKYGSVYEKYKKIVRL
jgi:protein-S-isoprenylcysteine O-methyltransferase Ste14